MFNNIKFKIAIGVGVLFSLLLSVSILSFFFITQLSHKTEHILSANYRTTQYCNQMMYALHEMESDSNKLSSFENTLQLQAKNITESGESKATEKLQLYFELYKQRKEPEILDSLNQLIYNIALINQQALDQKNKEALTTAKNAKLWISVFSSLLIILGLFIMVKLPGYIANPVRTLTDGIKEIASKNYHERIYLSNKDEFGEMASAFNLMAEKLYEYENSNLNKILSEKHRLDTIINQIEDGIIGLDEHEKIIFINNTAQSILNLNPEEVHKKSAVEIAINNDSLRYMLQNKGNDTMTLHSTIFNKDNYFSIHSKAVQSEHDAAIGEVYVLKNITHFKKLDLSKTNLIATISHQLKTPISSIKMCVKLLEGNSNTDEENELINNIKDDTDRLLHITAELLNMTQIETGKIQLKIQKVEPLTVVNNALKAVESQVHQKDINIQTHYQENLPLIMADPDKTSWVLINFLTNAIKFSSVKSPIFINVSIIENKIQFSVKDYGPGINQKYADKVFDQYFRIPDTIEDGTGLGLAISMEFIQAQGGDIYFKNNEDKGVTFSFTLPISDSINS